MISYIWVDLTVGQKDVMITQPPFLKKGDKIGLVAPARAIEQDKMEFAEKIIRSWGLQPIRGKNLLGKHFQYSGTDENRLHDLQEMMDHDEIKAVLCAGGGYGSVRLISKLRLEKFIEYPKWLIGFSDITILHALIESQTGIQTIHGTMPVKFGKGEKEKMSMESLRQALFGELGEYEIQSVRENVHGQCKGTLIGGNLSILYSLLGTPFDMAYKDKILFVEEVDEYLYHIDRMMQSLRLAGKLKQLKGLIVGSFSKVHDNESPFGSNEREIILQAVSGYDFPVMFGFPAGHSHLNMALYLGRKVHLEVREETCTMKYV